MNGVNLNQFQFDYDQTWAVMFLRADGTVLARYGSRNEEGPMSLNSLDGLKATMARVLDANRRWPADQVLYHAKRGPAVEFETAQVIPSRTIREILARDPKTTQGCIHCHNIYDAARDIAIERGEYDPHERWKYPPPESIGISVDPRSGTEITSVAPESPSAAANLAAGDEVFSINGQRIHSMADIQFALHQAAPQDSIEVAVMPAGSADRSETALKTAEVSVRPGWKASAIGWRASMYGMPPRPGLWVQAATDREKAALGIAADRLALKVRGAFGEEVKRTLKKGDVIVGFGNRSNHHSEGDFHGKLRLDYYDKNAKLPLRVRRGDQTLDVTVTFANDSQR